MTCHLNISVRATLLAIILSLFVIPASFADQKSHILVTVEGIKAEQGGSLIVALFNAEGSWPKHDTALRREVMTVTGSTMQIIFEQVATDKKYAIQILHDRNGNDKLDFRWFPYPKPKEGVGVSNNNRRIGPPSYEKALFQVEGLETTLTIQLGY